MPRYYFDVRAGDQLIRDWRGIDLPDASRIWEVALIMVDEIGAAGLYLQRPDSISVIVRDISDDVVYRSDRIGPAATRQINDPLEGHREVCELIRCVWPLMAACPHWKMKCRVRTEPSSPA